MEPITLASAFATIVGLMGVFKAEQRAEETASINQYIEWLRQHQHEQLVDLILNNVELSNSIQSFLSIQHDEVMNKLQSLDQVISEVASHLASFKPITDAMSIKSRISLQAVSILRQLNEHNASKFAISKTFNGTTYKTWDRQPKDCSIEITEPRFIDDDLHILCELGLLRINSNQKGLQVFSLTRAGSIVGA
ncbi:MAG: hypothetical protein ACF8OB_05710 [Phycisphaeraceae bacterium JB051]